MPLTTARLASVARSASVAGLASTALAHPIIFVSHPDALFYIRDFPDTFRSQAD